MIHFISACCCCLIFQTYLHVLLLYFAQWYDMLQYNWLSARLAGVTCQNYLDVCVIFHYCLINKYAKLIWIKVKYLMWSNISRNGIFSKGTLFSYIFHFQIIHGPSWSWWYGSWIYKLKLWVRRPFMTSEVYSIQYYETKFVSDLRQVGAFLRVLRFPPPIKLISTM